MSSSDSPSEQILEQAAEAVVYANRHEIIERRNAAAIRMFGFSAPEALGQSLDLMIPEHLRKARAPQVAPRAMFDQIGPIVSFGRVANGIMTTTLISCRATDGLTDVLSVMQAKGPVHIPVGDTEGKPPGVVNARDALPELMLEDQYEAALLCDYAMGVGYD